MSTDPPIAEPRKRKRRWLQFSLRTLLVVTAIVALGCAWVARRGEKKRQEREAIVAIQKKRGDVNFDYEFDESRRFIPNAAPPGPEWLRKLLGDNFFAEAIHVNLIGHEVNDSDLLNVSKLTDLRMLGLNSAAITDAGLQDLSGLEKLDFMNLSYTEITDSGIATLKEFKQLRWVSLNGTRVTPVGVKELQRALPDCTIFY